MLGPPRVEVDGAPLVVDTRKAVAVLVHAALVGEQTRDQLAALLWPDADHSRARSALRRTLSVLNKGLDGRWLLLEDQKVGLDHDGLWTDVDEFRRLSTSAHGHPVGEPCADCLDRLERAVALHRGDLLEGFAVRGAAAFDEWQFLEAEGLRRELAAVLDRLVNGCARLQRFDAAVTYGERRLELDGLHEPTHRRLMLLHQWAGRRADAIRQYRDCVAVLQRELGVAPLDQTTQLYESILSGEAPDPPAPTDGGPAPPTAAARSAVLAPRRIESGTRAFVGRQTELRRALDAHAGSDRGRLVAVEGEVGIGKSRFGQAFAAAVSDRGGTVLAVRANESERELAFTVIADLLREVELVRPGALRELSSAWLRELAPIVPDLVDGPSAAAQAHGGSSESRRRLLEAARQALVAAIGHGDAPGLLLLDDLQWADDASLETIRYLCNRLDRTPVCVTLIWRSEGTGVEHPVRRIVADLRRQDRVTRIELGRFDPDEVADLVEASGVRPDDRLVARLHAETEGLPLFLTEYLRTLTDDGYVNDGGWPVPTGVRDLLLARLAPLSGVARQVLTAAAAIGRSFDLDTLQEVSGRGEEELIAALEEIVDTGLVTEVHQRPRPRLDFRHDKLRSIAYEEASLGRRRLLHARIARAYARLERRGETVGDALVAQHLRLAGRDRDAAERFVAAAERARTFAAHDEAASHYRAALALGHPDPAGVNEAIGQVLTLKGDYAGAVASYEAAAATTDDPTELARLEYELATVHGRRGDWPAAGAHVEVALATLPATPDPTVLRARLLIERATVTHRLGREGAGDHAEEALTAAVAAGEPRTIARAHNVHAIVARAAGALDRAEDELRHSLRFAEELGSRGARLAALNNLALVANDRGETGRALELAKSALAICRSIGDRHREAALLNNIADLLRTAGQEEEAMEHVKQAVAIFADIGEPESLEPEIWKLVDW